MPVSIVTSKDAAWIVLTNNGCSNNRALELCNALAAAGVVGSWPVARP